MARLPEVGYLYTAINQFTQNCILDDRSILWPDKNIWTIANLRELKKRFIDGGMVDPKLSFEEKLQVQLSGGLPELWALLADIYYVYFLPSANLTLGKRQKDIQWAANQGRFLAPAPDDPIWEPQRGGFTHTGVRYHQKYMQFWLIILFALRVKESEDPQSFFTDNTRMQTALDEILESISKSDRAYGMRHAILYMAFPERYERIISTRDKKAIRDTYAAQASKPLPVDLDEALFSIRQALSPKHDEDGNPYDYYRDLRTEWRPDSVVTPDPEPIKRKVSETGPSYLDDLDFIRVRAVLKHTKNVILYGPPGTGKTYVARKVAEDLVKPQLERSLTGAPAISRVISDLKFYEVLALSMYLHDPKASFSVPDLLQHEIIQSRFSIAPVKHPSNQVWGYLQTHTDPANKTVNYTGKGAPYLFDKDKNSQWKLLDSGRQYVEENLTDPLELLKKGQIVQPKLEDFLRMTTFHQSFAYEDFVEGLRPAISEDAQENIRYEITPGIFREICTLATQDPENQYILIIDEINRGNIAKIFGELITLVEDDKRGELKVTLPYSKDSFSVPANLYLIGTMNTADRSIALMDVALRRRFAFVELMPRLELLMDLTVETESSSVNLAKLLDHLNKEISRHIDRDHQIGHSYFMKLSDVDDDRRIEQLDFIWNYQILPLLEEYFYSQQDKLRAVLSTFFTSVEADPELLEGNPSIGRAHAEDLIDSLSRLYEKKA